MANGRGRGKGRPRKTINIERKANSPAAIARLEVGDTSMQEEVNVAVDAHETMEAELETEDEQDKPEIELDKHKEASEIGDVGANPAEKQTIPLRTRGMKLDYVAPTLKNGKPTACLVKAELEKEALKWKNVVILYVIGDTPTIAYLTTFLRNNCCIACSFEIYYHVEGYFVVKFEKEEGKEYMLYEGPHSIASRPIIVKEWVNNFSFEKEILKEVPLWVQLPKLPLNCWSSDSLSRIGSVLGRPVCADECTSAQKRISYARLLIEIDVTQPLKYSIQVEGDKGEMVEQKVFYEWVPMFCKKCQMVGHICNSPPTLRAD